MGHFLITIQKILNTKVCISAWVVVKQEGVIPESLSVLFE